MKKIEKFLNLNRILKKDTSKFKRNSIK